MTPAARLLSMLKSPGTTPVLEAHDALSARIAAEAGFEALWASSLTLSTVAGVIDNSELSMTELCEAVERMTTAVPVPVLVDGDSGYGDFNHAALLTERLERRGAAGVCFEDKRFPKLNSFVQSERQALVEPAELTSKLRAARDAARDPDFVIVARTEALVTGRGLDDALARAEAYADAGATAVLVHSRAHTPDEVRAFLARWRRDVPVVCVPTTYGDVPFTVFEELGLAAVIWANHSLRAAVRGMQDAARALFESKSPGGLPIASLDELFRLARVPEHERRAVRYGAPWAPDDDDEAES